MKPCSNRGKSFRSYCRKVFKTSLITSFPEIAASKSCTKRLIKVLVFVACTIGFSFQTLGFLKMYLAYPTIVDVDITEPLMVEQPGITFCNLNRLRRTFLCTYDEDACIIVDPVYFCNKYPIQCPRNKPENAFTGMVHINDLFGKEFYWDNSRMGTHNESMLRRCRKKVDEDDDEKCTEHYLKVPVVHQTGEPNNCYSIESQYGKPDTQPDKYANFYRIEVTLSPQPEEYVNPNMPIQMRLALHDRKARINPFEPLKGHTLNGGIQYVAYVSMVSKERLPHPYDTNCTDYLQKWRENNGTGPLNENMCVEKCKLKKLLERGPCVKIPVFYPHDKPLCNETERKSAGSITESMLKECYMECGYACSEHSYEAIFQEVGNSELSCGKHDVYCNHVSTWVTFDFNKFRHTKYISQPKFESVELFSYLGGYMGMWIGVSCITLFDLLETLCYLLFYPIGRSLHKKSRINRFQATSQLGKNYYNGHIVVY